MASSALLNLEPSQPEERKQQHLPLKSDVDTAEEGLDGRTKENLPVLELYAGQGEDAAPRSPRRNMHRKSGSLRMNGHSREKKESSVIVQKYEDKDEKRLLSLRSKWDREKKKPLATRRNSELVSGRKAGARWEKAQYVSTTHQRSPHTNQLTT